MAESRPHLIAVDEPPAEAASPSRAPRSRRLPWLLAVLALVCAIGWVAARREVSSLEEQLAASQGALAESLATLKAAEAQRTEVRTQLEALSSDASALSQRLSDVQALLATNPAPAADAQPVRNEAEPAN